MAIVYPVEIKDVLKIQDGPLTGNLKPVMDGTNTPSPLRLSTTEVEINGKVWPTAGATAGKVLSIDNFGRLVWATPAGQDDTEYLPVAGGSITGDLVVEGNLQVLGEQTFNDLSATGNLSIDGTTTLDGNVTAGGNVAVAGELRFKTSTESVVTISAGSGNITLNPNDGSYQTITITGSTTFSFASIPNGRAGGFILEITNGGSQNVFWPASVRWPKSVGPTLSAGSTDLISFITRNGGATWYGTFRPGA